MATNEELFREWQSGKASALATLVQRHHAPLVAHLYRLLGDSQQAEDLAQETFFRLVRNARSYRYPQPFLPWLYSTSDGGEHWAKITPVFTARITGFAQLNFVSTEIGWALGYQPETANTLLFKTADGGLTWTQVPLATP